MTPGGTNVIDERATSPRWQAAGTRTCVLPVGSTEQHGPHLPLDTDSILAEFFGRQIAQALDAALLPTLRYGTSLEHTGFRGSISLRPETLMQVIRDLADEVERQGFTAMIVVNGHGGNHCLLPVVRDINRADGRLKILLVQPGAFCDPALAKEGRGPDFHAGEWETSLMLAICPDLVGSQRPDMPIEEGAAHPLAQADLTTFGVGHLNPAGVIGQPSLATPDKGRAIVASVLENIVPHLKERLHRLDASRRYAGTGGIALREMTAKDIAAGMRLVQEAGWNQTEEDWQLFLQRSPARCYVAVADGRVVGTITTLDHRGQVAWMSMLLVDPEFRQMGIGSRLFDRALEAISECPVVALDATPAGQGLYAQRGFEPGFELDRLVTSQLLPLNGGPPSGVRPIAEEDWPAIAALDRPTFGADRTPVLRALWARAPQRAWAYMRERHLAGYCFGRDGSRYVQVGPVVAETSEDALALCRASMRGLTGRAVVLDVPVFQPALRAWLYSLGFARQRSLVRMTRSRTQGQATLAPQFERQCAIAGPELG
jgi:creatinine amidohydrolase/Fe(II)-dependent formamide hydrolase-like protein/GNAT superfamily N-acetyltransferase